MYNLTHGGMASLVQSAGVLVSHEVISEGFPTDFARNAEPSLTQ